MGYYIDLHDHHLRWKDGVDLDKALEDVKTMMFTSELDHYLGVNSGRAVAAKTMHDFLGEFFADVWSDEYSPQHLHICPHEKQGDEDVLLEYLTPYLEDGSYLRYRGNDGEYFGWEVNDGKLIRQRATLTWVDDEDF